MGERRRIINMTFLLTHTCVVVGFVAHLSSSVHFGGLIPALIGAQKFSYSNRHISFRLLQYQ
jgi:hypothetical protein